MAWTINPNDPVHSWVGYDICVHTVLDNGMGQNEIDLIYRTSGAANPWQSMGASDGTVWAGDMIEEMAAMGGFKPWRAKITSLINARLASWASSIHPAPPVGDPANFAQYQAWLPSNIRWIDAADTVTIAQT